MAEGNSNAMTDVTALLRKLDGWVKAVPQATLYAEAAAVIRALEAERDALREMVLDIRHRAQQFYWDVSDRTDAALIPERVEAE